MVFLVVLALLTSTLLQTAVLEVRMAGNSQFREVALQRAKGVASELSLVSSNFNPLQPAGFSRCVPETSFAGCDANDLALPGSVLTASHGTRIDARIVRRLPLSIAQLPIRESQEVVSSAGKTAFALFEVDVEVLGNEGATGRARLVHGMAARLAEVLP